MFSWKSHTIKVAATAVTAGALIVGGGVAANAINRVSCTSYNFLWLNSPNTSCWANAGTRSVTLYDVYGVNSGTNAGSIASPSGGYSFGAGVSFSFPARTVTSVTIY